MTRGKSCEEVCFITKKSAIEQDPERRNSSKAFLKTGLLALRIKPCTGITTSEFEVCNSKSYLLIVLAWLNKCSLTSASISGDAKIARLRGSKRSSGKAGVKAREFLLGSIWDRSELIILRRLCKGSTSSHRCCCVTKIWFLVTSQSLRMAAYTPKVLLLTAATLVSPETR